jgi:hypothetical protein
VRPISDRGVLHPWVAPICRKRSGSITAEIHWLLYAENGLAPMCRKMTRRSRSGLLSFLMPLFRIVLSPVNV